jgi:hypothetical protein
LASNPSLQKEISLESNSCRNLKCKLQALC